ncbi:hypothetical protein ACQ27_gp458 [Klebsiella phage K64-1]|nr:hypothetical protein ACQ27_gp458 [Klebsiella phage K64-1]
MNNSFPLINIIQYWIILSSTNYKQKQQ